MSDPSSTSRSPTEVTEFEATTPPPLPKRIGGYDIISVLGTGGMGIVYEAEQQHPRRPVALKVVLGSRIVDARYLRLFDREGQTLARLQHPGIASIYESGHTEEGHHFFAMELIRGQPLHIYVRYEQPNLKARLGLFRSICDAVNYAHQRGVIHRDLKPSNIFVTSSGQTKILDFGLARITDTDITVATVVTEVGRIQGTLTHMSPEQARGNPDEIDLRSDVYSLGVILYELLTDALPYSVNQRSLPEAVRVICEQMPRRLMPQDGRLPVELQTIALKTLEKAPSRRYQSVAALREDIERFQSHQPILAHPPSAWYQLRKLLARHRVAASFLGMLAATVLAFGVWMSVLYRRADHLRIKAEQASRVAESEGQMHQQILSFLLGTFRAPDPNVALGEDVTARQLLEEGVRQIHADRDLDPNTRANLLDTFAQVYRNLGLYTDAIALQEESLQLMETHSGDNHPSVALAMRELGWAYKRASDYRRADAWLQRALEAYESIPSHATERALTLVLLGGTKSRMGRLDQAKELITKALAIQRELIGPTSHEAQATAMELAKVLRDLGELEEAERAARDVIENLGGRPDMPSARRAYALSLLGSIQRERGLYDLAAQHIEESVALFRHIHKDSHPYTDANRIWLALVWRDKQEYVRALDELTRVLAAAEAHSAGWAHKASAKLELGWTYAALKRWGEARPLFAETQDVYRARLGESNPKVAETYLGLATVALAQGSAGDAQQLARQALETFLTTVPESHWRVARSRLVLGFALARLGRVDDAEAECRTALFSMRAIRGPKDRYLLEACEQVRTALYAASGSGHPHWFTEACPTAP